MPLRAAVISSGVAVFDSTSGGAAAAAVDSFAMMGETLAVQLLTELCWACLHAAVQLRAAVAMVAILWSLGMRGWQKILPLQLPSNKAEF